MFSWTTSKLGEQKRLPSQRYRVPPAFCRIPTNGITATRGEKQRYRVVRPSQVVSYNGWEPRPVRFSQPLVASLGALQVTSTFKRRQQDSGPKAIELKGLGPEIPSTGRLMLLPEQKATSVQSQWQDGANFPGVGDLGTLDTVMIRQLGMPCLLF